MRQTLTDFFCEFASLRDPYLIYDNGYRTWSYTYEQVSRAARHFSLQLRAQGICKGDKVVFWAENRPEWVAAFWGCVISGVVVVPIDYRSTPELLRRVVGLVNPRAILLGDETKLPSWDVQSCVWRMSELVWPEVVTAHPELLDMGQGPEDVAEIVFTSGATGEPKGVLITHRNILSNLASPERIISKYVGWFRPVFPLRFLNLVPLSHMFGQALALFILPLIPAVAVFMRSYSPQEIAKIVRSRRISVVIAVPRMLDALRTYISAKFPESSVPPREGAHWMRRWWQYRKIHRHYGWKFWAFVSGAAPLESEIEAFLSRLGFVVIQGYGLTETAPIVAFNNPFAVKKGTVGRPIEGMEVRIAEDGEVLVRGESVTPGYFGSTDATASALVGGWLHTGDIGELDDSGRLVIHGRKKEVIVTPEGLKVFPEDVERVLNVTPGVRESAIVGKEHPHAVLVLEGDADAGHIVRLTNQKLEDHQRIRGLSIWPGPHLPRTPGTGKLRRAEIQRWVNTGTAPRAALPPLAESAILDIVRKYAPGRAVNENTTLDELGLSSIDRVELMIEMEQHLDLSIDESALSGERALGDFVHAPAVAAAPLDNELPRWSRTWAARCIRNATQCLALLPLMRLFTWIRVRGNEHLAKLQGPVIFAANHQSNLDTPAILAALPWQFRFRIAVAMWKEFFDAHFHPERHNFGHALRDHTLYTLVTLFFNAFPLPQTEAGARGSLRYVGDLVSAGWSILYFPEGGRTVTGEIQTFQPGIGLIASRLGAPIVPVRLRGLDKALPRGSYWPRPGRVQVTFGPALQLKGEDYTALARQVEAAVRAL